MTRGATDMDVRFRLELESLPDASTLIRSVITTVGRSAGLNRRLLDDLRTAVSEAANNVVLHAYPDEPGPLIFSLLIQRDRVEAVVRDRGCGMGGVSLASRGLGMGVVVINALADQAEFQTDEGTGTEVRLTFWRPIQVLTDLSPLNLGVWQLVGPRASVAPPSRSG